MQKIEKQKKKEKVKKNKEQQKNNRCSFDFSLYDEYEQDLAFEIRDINCYDPYNG